MTTQTDQHRWHVVYPLGKVEACRAAGTVAAPLLAGFTLATTVVLRTAERQPPLQDWATALFVAAASAFIFAMQFTYCGLLYSAPPSERLAWLPRPVGGDPSVEAHTVAARVQRKDRILQGRYFKRAGFFYNVGILTYLAGLIMTIVVDKWTVVPIFALLILIVVFVVEAIWVITVQVRQSPRLLRRSPRWLVAGPRWLLPGYDSLPSDGASSD